mmetsp:Transcript_49971/g.79069  ORF Transcript_49971/g.79069 Transcript_49971/m.79069 type:complete len:209 (+) Transcript_49971:76-702(+)|eukprot:CAMPEP_0169063052 /NCGR_PEP_ID=MMETSP1015-20121227/1055_1 /TAXON_ID=342587 /ORGANISM="Karlodinium micrum, Strain CCMP2283" /LENGTH=208 /DNA_ID=CAMNT_0009121315 /DNA_START=69 /DNA_END=695 /DNA_ORIENTATION=+
MANLSGRMEKYLDLTRSPGCSVVMAQSRGKSVEIGRPQFKSLQNPFQHDKSYLNRLDIHRQHTEEALQNRMLSLSGDANLRTTNGWRHGEEDWTEAGSDTAPSLARSLDRSTRQLSSPALGSKTFFCKAAGQTIGVSRLAPGCKSIAHLPGYMGFIPAYSSESHASLGCGFGKATMASLDLRRTERSLILGRPERKVWGVTPFSDECN